MSGILCALAGAYVAPAPTAFSFTISSNQTNANLRTLAVNAGWNQSSRVVATISSGVLVSANSTGTPGLTVNGSFPGGVELVNNGTIAGMGGAGGRGSVGTNTAASGLAGGLALSVSSPLTFRNNGTVGGGGGGGGGGAFRFLNTVGQVFPGGGGGGGRTGATNSAGGAAGTGTIAGNPGSPGTSSAGGAGGARVGSNTSGLGGTGGNYGSVGGAGTAATAPISGTAGGGGAAGAAISGNGNITYLATGTRLGAIT